MRPLLAVFLPLCIAYATALQWVVDRWMMDDGYYSHGPLVPVVALVVIWLRRERWLRQPSAADVRGWWLLGPALGMHLCGAALMIDSLSAASLVLAIPGAAWLALGRARLRGLWPVLWLPLLAVPLPIFVTGRIAFTLKEVAVAAGTWVANLFGLGAVRDGAMLIVPDAGAPLEVADPCGGLRSLLAMVTLVYCIAFFMGPPSRLRRTVLLLVAGPIALLVNVVRIAAICWLAHWQGVAVAAGWGHDVLNAGAWILDLAIILGIEQLLARAAGAGDAPSAAEAPAAMPVAGVSLRRTATALWIVAVPLLALSLYRPFTESSGRAEALPAAFGSWTRSATHEISDRYHELLGTSDATWRTYVDDAGREIFVVAVFHEANWKSVHPPHICLEGSDMSIQEDGIIALPGSGQTVGRILARRRAAGRDYLSLYLFGTSDFATPSYWSFFWHHAPRALFRASTAGFLVRVETFVLGGDVAAAEARCLDFLGRLLPDARGLLR